MAVFLIGAATGGVVFGWLGDRIGRVRAMSLSIITYALFTGACGLATEAWHIAVLRFIASLGMGGEWSLGVALVNEMWSERSRGWIAGLIGAASNIGIGLVPVVSIMLGTLITSVRGGLGEVLPASWVESLLANQAWRFLMIAGALPALLVFFIRACVPESHRWQEEKRSGRTAHWAGRDLLATLAGALGTWRAGSHDGLCGRLNGSDFALLALDADATGVATELRSRVESALAPWPQASVALAAVPWDARHGRAGRLPLARPQRPATASRSTPALAPAGRRRL
jgi:MFS family permease